MTNKFKIEIISATSNPQKTCWIAGHQDYSSHFASDRKQYFPSESKSGDLIVEKQLKGWSRAKKEALIAGDWQRISELARK